MTLDGFIKKYNKLKYNNPNLIMDYENKASIYVEDELPLIYTQYKRLGKYQSSTDPINFIQSVICQAMYNKISLCDAADEVVSTALLSPNSSKTAIQYYFKEISQIYNKNNNNYNIEYCEDSVDKLIEMNLKTVISVARGYQGLGLSLEELISAGNLGLVICAKGDEKTHTPKYDPSRAKLKDDMIESLIDLENDATPEQIIDRICKYMTYGDVKKKFMKFFNIDGQWVNCNKKEVMKWIRCNVRNASFNSIAFMWIRAYILIEIDNCSRLVKKPKTEIYNDKLKYGTYRKEVTLDIDAPIGDSDDMCICDNIKSEEEPNDLEISEAYDIFKDGLNKLLDGVKPRDRSVFLKRFGIGIPRPMLPKEIAEQENLSIARISQLFQSIIEQMKLNQKKYNINPDILFNAVRKIN